MPTRKFAAVLALSAAGATMSAAAAAEEWPLALGDFWEVTGIDIAWRQMTIAQMQTDSGNRAQCREVLSDALLQELTVR